LNLEILKSKPLIGGIREQERDEYGSGYMLDEGRRRGRRRNLDLDLDVEEEHGNRQDQDQDQDRKLLRPRIGLDSVFLPEDHPFPWLTAFICLWEAFYLGESKP